MSPISFIQRSIDDIESTMDARRGRVSYPILKGFMETEFQVAEVDLSDSSRKPQTLQMLLKSYIQTHKMPIKVFMRKGHMFLMRLDIDSNGNVIEDWYEKLLQEKLQTEGDVEEITTQVIEES